MVDAPHQQLADMRQRGNHKVQVASVDIFQLDVRVEDPDISSLPDQVLNDCNHRALAQVVCPFLERKPEDTDPLAWQRMYIANAAPEMLVVGGQNRLQQR